MSLNAIKRSQPLRNAHVDKVGAETLAMIIPWG